MYKLLVIDDEVNESTRSEIYSFILDSKFEYDKIINDLDAITDLLRMNHYDCILLDNNLDTGSSKDEVMSVVRNYSLPIIMVSGARDFNTSDWNIPYIIDCISLQSYIMFKNLKDSLTELSKKEIFEKAIEIALFELERRIAKSIYTYCGYDSSKTTSDKLVIYHISDLQFGDKHANSIDLTSFFPKLQSFILGRAEKPDMIALTGDIVFSGKDYEYSEVKKVIEPFLLKIFGLNAKNRLLLVPGNHDFNYDSFFMSENKDYYQLTDSANRKITEFCTSVTTVSEIDKKNIGLTPKDFNKFNGSDVGLHEFSKFAFELTQNFEYFNQPFYINRKCLLSKAFEIIGISNAYKFFRISDKDKRYEFEYNILLDKIDQAKRFRILVGHATPKSLGFMQTCPDQSYRQLCNKNYEQECAEEGCQKWGDTERLMTDLNAIIYLHGHGHYSNYKITSDRRKIFISAGSPSGVNNTEKTINIIEISTSDKKINLTLVINKCTSKGIEFSQDHKFLYDICTEKWDELKDAP